MSERDVTKDCLNVCLFGLAWLALVVVACVSVSSHHQCTDTDSHFRGGCRTTPRKEAAQSVCASGHANEETEVVVSQSRAMATRARLKGHHHHQNGCLVRLSSSSSKGSNSEQKHIEESTMRAIKINLLPHKICCCCCTVRIAVTEDGAWCTAAAAATRCLNYTKSGQKKETAPLKDRSNEGRGSSQTCQCQCLITIDNDNDECDD